MQYLNDLAVESVKFVAMAASGAGGTAIKGAEALGVAAKVVEGAAAAKVVANAVPSTMARVIPNGVPVATLGKPGAGDVFVTAAQDIGG